MQPIDEQGYVIVAVNSDNVDYQDCARTLAKTIRYWDPSARICLVTDSPYTDPLYDHHRQVVPDVNPFANDAQLFRLTPFRETIKLEADMLIVSPIDHWWTLFALRDVVISQGARDFYDQASACRRYRKIFEDNHLPDVYNAITYWRVSQTAQEFFHWVRNIFHDWNQWKTLLKFPDEQPTTDLVYAMAAMIMGTEQITLPQGLGPNIIHMKKHVIPIASSDWTTELVWEDDPVRINTVAQWGLVHYHIKDWRL